MRRLGSPLFSRSLAARRILKMRRGLTEELNLLLDEDPDQDLASISRGLERLLTVEPLHFADVTKIIVPSMPEEIEDDHRKPPVLAYFVQALVPYSGTSWLWMCGPSCFGRPIHGRASQLNLRMNLVVDSRDIDQADELIGGNMQDLHRAAERQQDTVDWVNSEVPIAVAKFLIKIAAKLPQLREEARQRRKQPCPTCPFTPRFAA